MAVEVHHMKQQCLQQARTNCLVQSVRNRVNIMAVTDQAVYILTKFNSNKFMEL